MTKLSYWERRQLKVKASQLDNTAKLERTMLSQLTGAYHEIAKEASMWVDKYAKNQGVNSEQAMRSLHGIKTKHWRLTLKQFEAKAKQGGYESELNDEYYRSRLARLSALEEQMRQLTRGIAHKHIDTMRTALGSQYNDTYMRSTFNIQAQKGAFTSDFAHFNETQLKIVASNPWGKDGKDFSQRIWKNYQQELPSYLMDSLFRATVMGWGPQKVGQMMHAQFQDVQRNRVHNLVTSEMGHIAEEATAKSYEESGIDEYEYMATLESHTCTICGHLDGQHFKMSERQVGVNYPLIHARCRCTTVPYIADLPDVGERWMRDPETGKGKLIKNVQFDEWKRQYAPNTIKAAEQTKITKKSTQNGLSVNRKLVNSKQFHDKFDTLELPKQTQESLYHDSMAILEHRDGTNYEDLYVLDQRTGELVVKQDQSNDEGKTGLTYDQFEQVQEYNGPLVLLHNHPNSSRPSVADIFTLYNNPQITQSVVTSHDGKVASIMLSSRNIDIEFLYKRWYNQFIREGNTKQEANLLATDKIYQSGAIIYAQN